MLLCFEARVTKRRLWVEIRRHISHFSLPVKLPVSVGMAKCLSAIFNYEPRIQLVIGPVPVQAWIEPPSKGWHFPLIFWRPFRRQPQFSDNLEQIHLFGSIWAPSPSPLLTGVIIPLHRHYKALSLPVGPFLSVMGLCYPCEAPGRGFGSGLRRLCIDIGL